MLKHLMTDSAELKSVQATNDYDLPSVQQIKTIKCKFEFAISSLQNSVSASSYNTARLFCCEENIFPGDIISFSSVNYKVIQVNKYKDLDGLSVLCEVFLQ